MNEEIEDLLKIRTGILESSLPDVQKIQGYAHLFNLILSKATSFTSIQFTSAFARLSFLISAHNIPYQEGYLLHSFRKSKYSSKENARDSDLLLAEVVVKILFARLFDRHEDLGMVLPIFQDLSNGKVPFHSKFKREESVLIEQIDLETKQIVAQLNRQPYNKIDIAFDRPERNEDYTELFHQVLEQSLLPLKMNLVDIEISEQGTYYPLSFVIEPDFLYDVTAVSECFASFGNHQGSYLMRKFLKKSVSQPLLVGNLVNFFLDQLVYHPELTFKELLNRIFRFDPLSIALLDDQDVREMLTVLERHFLNIKNVVLHQFQKINIDDDTCQVEPSFYSVKYGIQGRLDLFALKNDNATIIELKSGSSYRPNQYGLSNNHYHQTLLYDMLIESVYGQSVKRNNFILYSKESSRPLRYAPSVKAEQRESIKERNRLYLHDRVLMRSGDFIDYYSKFFKKNASKIKGFIKQDFQSFLDKMEQLDPLERKYCNQILKFSLNELFISKLGLEESGRNKGLANLWGLDIDSKKEQFSIINHLTLMEDHSNSAEPHLVFEHSQHTNTLHNFRIGDIGILYASDEGVVDVLRKQVFKITVVAISENKITVRLRSRQDNPETFVRDAYWNIEHDVLENGFYEMTRSIYEFSEAERSRRELLLGRRAPWDYTSEKAYCSPELTEEQQRLFTEIINAKEYYLLWGPPGTGKTSVMLKELAHHYLTQSSERILLMAYTNRAVDEICAALTAIPDSPDFIKIGSKYSTSDQFHSYLLDNQIADIQDRKSLRTKLLNTQIYVGTVASMKGKVALFEMIKFNVAIIDEASQILEPTLIGLLCRVDKFVLIGDHRQLPAIVLQKHEDTAIEDDDLKAIGIHQLATSMFERLFNQAHAKGWNHAFGQLTQQGRMHIEIMDFVNSYFYDRSLIPLPLISRLTDSSFFQSEKKTNRFEYYPTNTDLGSDNLKINQHEATVVTQICLAIKDRYRQDDKELTVHSMGIITPFRAQIAAIRKEIASADNELLQFLTIDTVERYQGGARDIIILSCCMNYGFQLSSLVSYSEDGIDRKLNVSITRAREKFILVGNRLLLEKNENYRNLIRQAVLSAMEFQ